MIADYQPIEKKALKVKGLKYDPNFHKTYDNYAAINCDKSVDIPIDYDGVIGVPITILNYLWSDGKIHIEYDADECQ